MTWLLTNLLPVTIGTLVVALALLGVIHYALGRWPSHPLAAVYGPFAASIVVAAVVGPAFTHVWAMKRDLEQRRWTSRAAHFERIRPILQDEAKALRDYAQRVREQGHLTGALRGSDIARNEDLMWNGHFLTSDLRSHFPDYFAARAQVQGDVNAHDRHVRETLERVQADLSGDDSVTVNVAMAVLHRCIRNGYGMRLQVDPNSWGMSYSAGGASSGGGPPSSQVLAIWNAFQTYEPSTSFQSECTRLKAAVEPLAVRLARLVDNALALSELATLTGECEYVRLSS